MEINTGTIYVLGMISLFFFIGVATNKAETKNPPATGGNNISQDGSWGITTVVLFIFFVFISAVIFDGLSDEQINHSEVSIKISD